MRDVLLVVLILGMIGCYIGIIKCGLGISKILDELLKEMKIKNKL